MHINYLGRSIVQVRPNRYLYIPDKFLIEFKSIDIDYAAIESECVRAGCSTEDQSSLRSVCKVFAAYRNSCQRNLIRNMDHIIIIILAIEPRIFSIEIF